MRLGVLMLGAGAQGAAGIGVLEALAKRKMEPFAVCGLHGGAWSAALFCAGRSERETRLALMQAEGMGKRLLRPSLLRPGRWSGGKPLFRLLAAQTGERMLTLCPRRGLFLCRTARSGRSTAFATHAYPSGAGTLLHLQATAAFAAWAAMAVPPLIDPPEWLGSPLLAETDAAMACGELTAMGAQRILIVYPTRAVGSRMDALELATAQTGWSFARGLPESARVLRVPLPERAYALSMESINLCADAGREAAERGLEPLLEQMGVSVCRVLPFRKRAGTINL